MIAIRIYFKNGSLQEIKKDYLSEAYKFVRDNISYSGGRITSVYICYTRDLCRCVHNERWSEVSNEYAKRTPL